MRECLLRAVPPGSRKVKALLPGVHQSLDSGSPGGAIASGRTALYVEAGAERATLPSAGGEQPVLPEGVWGLLTTAPQSVTKGRVDSIM